MTMPSTMTPRAIRLDPKYAFAYACRAQAWGRKHDREKQTADYTTAIELDPYNALYRLFRGSTWAVQGKHAAGDGRL